MVRVLDKLEVGKDGLIYRNTRDNQQLVLPQKFKLQMYFEFQDGASWERKSLTANQRTFSLTLPIL